jgi:hypothetical protein
MIAGVILATNPTGDSSCKADLDAPPANAGLALDADET